MWREAISKPFCENLGDIEGYSFKVQSLEHIRQHPDLIDAYDQAYQGVYFASFWHHIYRKEIKNPNVHQLVFSLFDGKTLVGSRSITFLNPHDLYWKKMQSLAKSIKCQSSMRGHNSWILKEFRHQGLMSSLIQKSNHFVYERYGVDYILGMSIHCYACRLYQKQGAEFYQNDIDNLYAYLPRRINHYLFDIFIKSHYFKHWKIFKGIRYSYNLKKLYGHRE